MVDFKFSATVVWFSPPHCSSQFRGRGERERLATSGLNGVLVYCYFVVSKKACLVFMIARALVMFVRANVLSFCFKIATWI